MTTIPRMEKFFIKILKNWDNGEIPLMKKIVQQMPHASTPSFTPSHYHHYLEISPFSCNYKHFLTYATTVFFRGARSLYATLTPIIALSSVIVTCFARSTADATCCWCSFDRKGNIWPIIALNLLAISVWNKKREKKLNTKPGISFRLF